MMKCWAIFSFLILCHAHGRQPISGSRFEQLTGKKTSLKTTKKVQWDEVYSRPSFVYGKAPARFLAENYTFIAPDSKVLDVGMGEGRNSVFLAQKGYSVTGIDISSVAIKKAKFLAKEYGVSIKTIIGSALDYSFPEGSFDSIIVFYFVDRNLIKKIARWLKPGGIIIFEAHTIKEREKGLAQKTRVDPEDYYLKPAELLSLFRDFQVLKFEEPTHRGEFTSSIIVRKAE